MSSMPQALQECRWTYCKTHLKTHKKPETKSGTVLKLVVKHVKSEIKPSVKMAIELLHDRIKRSSLSTRNLSDEVSDDKN